MFLDFLLPKEAEAAPVIVHPWRSRYIKELAARLSGFPKTATGGEVVSKLEASGVLPKHFGDAYLRDPLVPRSQLVEHLEENWMRPELYLFGKGAKPVGPVYSYIERVPATSAKVSFPFEGQGVTLEIEVPEYGRAWPREGTHLSALQELGGRIGRYATAIEEAEREIKSLLTNVARRAPRQKGFVTHLDLDYRTGKLGVEPVQLTFEEPPSSYLQALSDFEASPLFEELKSEVGKHYSKLRESIEAVNKMLGRGSQLSFEPYFFEPGLPTIRRRTRPEYEPTKFGYEQFLSKKGSPFELALTPGPGWPYVLSHVDIGDFLHVRGTKRGNSLVVQEIQSDWVRQYTDNATTLKPPPEALKKWPEHGAETALVYASRLPDVDRVIFLDEPAIAVTRGRGEGTYHSYGKALKYAERRAKELGAKTERVPVLELLPEAKAYKEELKNSRPLVVHLTDKVKEAIATGSLLGTGGLAIDWETGEWQLRPQKRQEQPKTPVVGDWLMRLFGGAQ